MEHNHGGKRQVLLQLEGALLDEHMYQPHLQLPLVAQSETDITSGMRDGSAHVLRCLKVWFDLPSEVLLLAIHSMDRFLSKMKALRKHLACIAVSALHLAACRLVPEQSPQLSQLAIISQCGCTERDLARMANLMELKLGRTLPTTPAHMLTLFLQLLEQQGISILCAAMLVHKMEIVACDASCSNFRACELALVLLCMHVQEPSLHVSQPQKMHELAGLVLHLQRLCQIGEASLRWCHELVLSTLDRYNHGHGQTPCRQRLVWRVSQRTMQQLRPTSKLIPVLPTIQEHTLLHLTTGTTNNRLQQELDLETRESSRESDSHLGSGDQPTTITTN